MNDDFLRVQGLALSDMALENQNGPMTRHLLDVWVTELFPQSRQVDVKQIRLVFDKTQLSLLQAQLLALELPPPEISSAEAQ